MAAITIPILSPLQGVNRVTARETQGKSYCWDAFNCFPFDAWGKARVAQRFGVGKAWGALGSTLIQGMLPVNYIAYSSTGAATPFPITSLTGTPVNSFTTTSSQTPNFIPTGSTTITPGSGIIGGGPPTGPIGGASTSTRRPNTGPGGSQSPGGPSGPGGSGGPGNYTGPGTYGGPASGSTTGGTPGRFGGPGGGGGAGSGTPTGGTSFGTGGTGTTFTLTATKVLGGNTATVRAYLAYGPFGGSGPGPDHFTAVYIEFDDTPTAHCFIEVRDENGAISGVTNGPIPGQGVASTSTIIYTFNSIFTTSGSTSNILATVRATTPAGHDFGLSTIYNGAGASVGSSGYRMTSEVQNPGSSGGFPGAYSVTFT